MYRSYSVNNMPQPVVEPEQKPLPPPIKETVKKEQKKFNKDTYLLFDCLHDVSAEAVDAYSLFEYMRSIGLSAYYVVRKQSKLYNYLCKEGKLNNVIVLNFSSRSHPNEFISKIYPVLLKTKAVITSFGENSGTIDLFFKRRTNFGTS